MNITLAAWRARQRKKAIDNNKVHEWETEKQINQLWKSEISDLFWRSGARVRDHVSPPGASSTRQTRRSRTLVGPVSLFWFVGRTVVGPTSRMSACWHGRRKLKPECTDQINYRELGHGDILFVDEEADIIVHPVHHVQPVQLLMHGLRHRWSVR